ncbi:helix-turn-helix domain-containing protein [uncultured Arthrobacter sp.]|uniref:helix-turn-helix domain-containing protein n=1 Tax=uncultured Arthrobacter sp. TaxID=114050 RepID=UPI0025F629FC|nr:helix-turn-helix domain-containing protein [uncultured Arthrobacter sp.]
MPATTSNDPQGLGGASVADITPIFATVKDAAAILGGLSPWTVNQLCRTGAIESRFHNRRRLVVLASLRAYAESLPTTREDGEESA